MSRLRVWLRRVKRAWIVLGTAALVIFVSWSLIAYRASPAARGALNTDERVLVTTTADSWTFSPKGEANQSAALLFLPGALVDPAAYAPLARAVAEAGFSATILKLPRRGAFGGAEDPELFARAREIMTAGGDARAWVVAGHSRGAVVATHLAADRPRQLAGLVFIGSSHPRDVSLAALDIPVMKIAGTRDGLASPGEVNGNRHNLPASTRWVWIEGGNHSQFGWYGFQPGDRLARISAEDQRAATIGAVVEMMRLVADRRTADDRGRPRFFGAIFAATDRAA